MGRARKARPVIVPEGVLNVSERRIVAPPKTPVMSKWVLGARAPFVLGEEPPGEGQWTVGLGA